MPILTRHIDPRILTDKGPLVTVEVYQTPLLAEEKNKPFSSPVGGVFLIDTGARSTCIKPHFAEKLKLKQVGLTSVGTPNQVSNNHPVYVAGLRIVVQKQTISFDVVRVVELPLDGQEIDGLLGRDILSNKMLSYMGFSGQFYLSV